MMNDESDEYREKYNNVCDHLMLAAMKLRSGLEPIDVAGAMVAVAIESLRHTGQDQADIGDWLHALASAVESGEVGLQHRTH